MAGSSDIVSIGHNTSIKNAATLRQSQYASHIHGIVSSFQHGSITDVHLVFSNLWHITTSAFVRFNSDNSHYLKALQTALLKMEMHEKHSLHSFKQPISTKDSHLIAEQAIWCCITDMLASLNAMARVNLSNTYSQAISFQLDQPWFLQLIQSLTEPALLAANSLIQWESKAPWPFLHKVYPELASVANDDSGLSARDDEDITDVRHQSKEKQAGDHSGKGANEVRGTSGNGGDKGKGKAVAGKRKRVGNNKKNKDDSNIEEEEEEEEEKDEDEEDKEEEEDALEERPMKRARIENGHLVIVKREPETLHMTDSYKFVDFIDLTHEIDEELPQLPVMTTLQDLSRKVKWLKLQRVMQCNGGSLMTENLLFKVPFPWECKQDMEIINLLFPKAKRPIEPVAKATSPEVTSPESPLSNLSESSKESSPEEEEHGARTEFNFYSAKCRPAALGNMDKLGRNGFPLGHIFPSSIKDWLTKSGVSREEKDTIRKLMADRPIQWVPDMKFNELKTVEEYEDFELDIQDLRDYRSRDPNDTYGKSHMRVGSIQQGIKLKRKAMNYLDMNYANGGTDLAIRVLADDTLAMQCPTDQGFDPYETNWMICATAASFHRAHMDCSSSNYMDNVGGIVDADPGDYEFISFLLEEDHYLTMDPGMIHFVLSLTDSVTQGGHFYNAEAFEKPSHPTNEWILHTLIIVYYEELLARFPKWVDKEHPGVKSSEYNDFAEEWIQPRNMAALLIMCIYPEDFEAHPINKTPYPCHSSVLDLREGSPSTARSILDFSPEINRVFLEIVKELDTVEKPLRMRDMFEI
ncbi:hypothetical protein M422DRAFT_256339 [Sphaerobolus stellatus SS14]|uniref:JmjC domain-containing protein n=1 Tax=Sphaerobolus stellatus (strain SS14) TaxID=990650 RepID=A0A0C9VQT7_SPHS4|nr:hypothetical protein M422DRAFT_256339 [Sphaerobolus stellatus SS14]